jgi:hypothetical protein
MASDRTFIPRMQVTAYTCAAIAVHISKHINYQYSEYCSPAVFSTSVGAVFATSAATMVVVVDAALLAVLLVTTPQLPSTLHRPVVLLVAASPQLPSMLHRPVLHTTCSHIRDRSRAVLTKVHNTRHKPLIRLLRMHIINCSCSCCSFLWHCALCTADRLHA